MSEDKGLTVVEMVISLMLLIAILELARRKGLK